MVAGTLPFVPQALDWLERVLSSACRVPASASGTGGEVPGGGTTAARPTPLEGAAPDAQELSSVLA